MAPPHLHPRSRATSSLFAVTLVASLLVVGLPHVLPCPAPRVTYAEGEMVPDGGRQKRRRRPSSSGDSAGERHQRQEQPGKPLSLQGVKEDDDDGKQRRQTPSSRTTRTAGEIVQFEAEPASTGIARSRRECPVPKPGGLIGEILGFRQRQQDGRQDEQHTQQRYELREAAAAHASRREPDRSQEGR